MKIQLSEAQKNNLEKQHKKEKNSKFADRIKSILLSSEGWSNKQIAQALRIHESTVSNHIDDYISKNKLKNESGGSNSYLSNEQISELMNHLEENTYPSTNEIIAYVLLSYGVKYTQQGMYDWLINNKFSYKHPKGVPLKHDKVAQEEFINKYNKLKKNLNTDDHILFMDSVHPTQETKITSGWIRKGVEKVIATVASRKRINLTGAVDLTDMSIFAKEYESINGQSTIDFLKYLDESTPKAKAIHLIADAGCAHTCKEVGAFLGIKDPFNRKYLEDNYNIKLLSPKRRITKKLKRQLTDVLRKNPELFDDKDVLKEKNLKVKTLLDALRMPPLHHKFILHILPSYSPNLNPIERVWKVMNEKSRNNVVFYSFSEFKEAILKFFKDVWNKIPIDELKSRINDNFEKIKLTI